MSPLKNIMKELQLRKVHIYPRFHEEVKASLERRKADVVELYQPLTESMKDIHGAIVQCMTTTLGELKRSNATVRLCQSVFICFKFYLTIVVRCDSDSSTSMISMWKTRISVHSML